MAAPRSHEIVRAVDGATLRMVTLCGRAEDFGLVLTGRDVVDIVIVLEVVVARRHVLKYLGCARVRLIVWLNGPRHGKRLLRDRNIVFRSRIREQLILDEVVPRHRHRDTRQIVLLSASLKLLICVIVVEIQAFDCAPTDLLRRVNR